MKLSQWMLAIGAVVGLGLLQVAQRNAIYLSSYGVGERVKQAHTREVELQWMHARLGGLASPGHLSQVAETRGMKLVAWSMLADEPVAVTAMAGEPPLVHLAAGADGD